MKLVLITFFAAVYYGAWWLFKHGQEVWAYCIFVPCTFLLFPLLWAALINGPAGTAPPDHSAGDRAINNVLVPAGGLTDSGSANDVWQSFPDLPADDEPVTADSQAQMPPQVTTPSAPQKGQKQLF